MEKSMDGSAEASPALRAQNQEENYMKHYVIVDIDGTLTKVGARVECLKADPPDWDGFYSRCSEDEPVPEILDLIKTIQDTNTIVLCSGRRESCRGDTMEWMEKHGIEFDAMLLRKDGDFRHDTIVKPEMLEAAKIPLDKILYVLEDRNAMVKKWREMGLICLQVAEGNF
jgi:hypothetical protein